MLRKILEKWKAFGQFLGNLLARVVLTLFYFTIFLPFGLLTTVFGDRLGIKKTPYPLWLPRETRRDSVDAARKQA